jgi:hypothetical protein
MVHMSCGPYWQTRVVSSPPGCVIGCASWVAQAAGSSYPSIVPRFQSHWARS